MLRFISLSFLAGKALGLICFQASCQEDTSKDNEGAKGGRQPQTKSLPISKFRTIPIPCQMACNANRYAIPVAMQMPIATQYPSQCNPHCIPLSPNPEIMPALIPNPNKSLCFPSDGRPTRSCPICRDHDLITVVRALGEVPASRSVARANRNYLWWIMQPRSPMHYHPLRAS